MMVMVIQVEPADLHSVDQKKRLSDLRFIMRLIEEKAQERDLMVHERPTIVDANAIFYACKDVTLIPAETEKNRRRRREQLTWRTVVNLIRKKRK
jgi:hypothetical protein